MALAVLKSVQSRRDIDEVFAYIAEDSLDAAIRFLASLNDGLQLIAQHPDIGSVPMLKHPKLVGVRIWPIKRFEKFLLFYDRSPDGNAIRLLRVLNSSRDFSIIFEGDE